jgi:hypothetical protein
VDDTPETGLLLRRGKLEQTCPACGRREAAGHYCSVCGRQTGAGDWYRNQDMDARREARERAPENPQPPVKRGRGRPKAETHAAPAFTGFLGL